MRRGLEAAVLVTVVALATALPVHAQTGRVAGRVLDQTGAALSGVTIDLVVSGIGLTATTDEAGQYQFEHVPPGAAEVTFRLLNFSVLRRTVEVGNASVAAPDTILMLALNADVVVTGTATFRNIADIANPAENLVGIAASASQGA